jgi:hypothetical protein
MKTEKQVRDLLEEKSKEYILKEYDFDGMNELQGYINALRTVLEDPDTCKTCNHPQGNHEMLGIGECLICESDKNYCGGFKSY